MQLPPIVENYIEAYNAMDLDGMLQCLTDDVRFQNILDGQVNVETRGKEQFAELARRGASAFHMRKQEAVRCIVVGTHVMAEIAYTATVAKDLPNGWRAGQHLAFSGASYFRLEDGRISEIIDQS
jgi:ketosteroid isomerase-like protein